MVAFLDNNEEKYGGVSACAKRSSSLVNRDIETVRTNMQASES